MLCRRKCLGKRGQVQFADPPWNEDSEAWQELDRRLSQDHVARRVVKAVKMLDLTPLLASYVRGGTPAIRPDLMLTIVLIEIQRGRHCASQWFSDTEETDSLKWAGSGITPSRSTWFNFADRIAPFIDGFNASVLQAAVEQGITQAKRAALDGSSVAAHASRHRLVNESTLEKRLEKLEAACSCDEKEEPVGELEGWMAKNPETRTEQLRRYRRARERLGELHEINNRQDRSRRRPREKIVVSTSDPEAALGRDKYNVFRPLYNVQFLSDLDSQLVLGYEVFARNNDAGTLGRMLECVTQMTGVKLSILLADATYITASNLAIGDQAAVCLYGPWQENDYSPKNKKNGKKKSRKQIPKKEFQWLEELQMYRCPEGHLLKWIGKQKRVQADGEVNIMHSYRCSATDCQVCPRREECTKNPDRGRSVKRSEHEKLVEDHQRRMETAEAKALYKLRRQTVELGFADLKQHRKIRCFSRRGLRRVRTEIGLAVLARNLLIVSSSPPQTEKACSEAETTVKMAA